MNFQQFAKVIEDLRKTNEVVDACEKGYIKVDLFSAHNQLIADLLEAIYEPDAITYVLYEWLLGNRGPLVQTLPDGTELRHDLTTVHDVWKVMEMYKVGNIPTELNNDSAVDSIE